MTRKMTKAQAALVAAMMVPGSGLYCTYSRAGTKFYLTRSNGMTSRVPLQTVRALRDLGYVGTGELMPIGRFRFALTPAGRAALSEAGHE